MPAQTYVATHDFSQRRFVILKLKRIKSELVEHNAAQSGASHERTQQPGFEPI